MDNLSPFTLIYESSLEASKATDLSAPAASAKSGTARGAERQAQAYLQTLTSTAPELAESLCSLNLNPNLQNTLLNTSFSRSDFSTSNEPHAQTLALVVSDLQRQADVTTVALWDLDTSVGRLPQIIKRLNETQPVFTFFELQGAPLPVGIVGRQQFMVEWVRERLHKHNQRLTRATREEIGNNLKSEDFYQGARMVHQHIGAKYLIGMTPYMIAGEDNDRPFWNYFTHSQGNLSLVSTYNLNAYARQAGRPLEVAVAMLFIAQLLVILNPGLGYHEDTGCILDFNDERDNIVTSIRELKLDDDCWKKIQKKYREATRAMLDALNSYAGEPEMPSTSLADPENDDYWLGQLDELSEG